MKVDASGHPTFFQVFDFDHCRTLAQPTRQTSSLRAASTSSGASSETKGMLAKSRSSQKGLHGPREETFGMGRACLDIVYSASAITVRLSY